LLNRNAANDYVSDGARVLCDELFHLNVDLVQHLTRSLETSILLWRILSGRAGPDGNQLLEDRRQRFVEYFSRGMRLRDKLLPFFV
jgi:hypothetical protein